MLAGNSSPRTWFIFTILISLIVLSETTDSRKSKESSKPRTGDSSEAGKLNEKLSSDSDSDDKKDGHNESPKSALESNSDSTEDGGAGGIHSTRGLKAEDFEPEDAQINLKAYHNSDDETDGMSSRRR